MDDTRTTHSFRANDFYHHSVYEYPTSWLESSYEADSVTRGSAPAQELNSRINFGKRSAVSETTYPAQGIFRNMSATWNKDKVDASNVNKIVIMFKKAWGRIGTWHSSSVVRSPAHHTPALAVNPIIPTVMFVGGRFFKGRLRIPPQRPKIDIPEDVQGRLQDLGQKIAEAM
jgi:hypothetical protein